MKSKVLLAAFFLGVGLCFVPALGYGEVRQWLWESKATDMDLALLRARVSYMMRNPTNFLDVSFHYDLFGRYGKTAKLPRHIDTKGKILVLVRDSRDVFSHRHGIALVSQFKRELEVIYSYVGLVATDMDTDIVAKFMTRDEIPLGYFYQGEYHLWEEW